MEPTTAGQPHKDIREGSQEFAHQWYLALSSAGCLQVDRTEALQKLSRLTERVLAVLLAENQTGNAGEEIGRDLADLPCTDPLAVELSASLWVRQLVEKEFPVEPAVLHPRMMILLGSMVAGFGRRARDIVLEQQEDVRSAMAADLLRATQELKKYQSQLEAMLAERTRELRESEEQFRVIAESSIDGVFQSTGADGKLIYANNSFAKMLGYTKEELLGRTTLSLIAEEDLPELTPIAKEMRGNKAVRGEFRLKHKNGQLIDIHFSDVPTMLNGRLVRSGIVQDITERKRVEKALFESEERYRTLADASPDMIYIIGRDDRIQYVNGFAARFLNQPIEAIIGQPRDRFFPAPNKDTQKKYILKVLKYGKSYYGEDEIRTDGRATWLGTWLVPLREASGNVSGVMGVSRDITKQKAAELEILRSRDELEKSVQERTAELITSQTQLRQLSNQLVTAMENERRRISRELHDEAGQALISLKYDLISIQSDMLSSNLHARSRLVNSIEVIDQVMSQIRELTHSLRPPVLEIVGIDLSLKDYCREFAKRTGLLIRYQGREILGLPDEIGISLYRFVQEALTNIVKHAHATRVDVKLQYRKKLVTLSVSDNGRGMEEMAQSGGIGLIGIEERFVLLGGSLKVQSREGKGVSVTACVPWPRPVERLQGGVSREVDAG